MKNFFLALQLSATLIGAIFFSMGVSAKECTRPVEPFIPDAKTTVTPEMIKAQNDVKQYMSVAQAYLDCVHSKVEHNKTVSRMEEVANDFNRAVRAFKARMSDS